MPFGNFLSQESHLIIMEDFFRKLKPVEDLQTPEIMIQESRPQDLLETKVKLKVLGNLEEKINLLFSKMSDLEKKLGEIPLEHGVNYDPSHLLQEIENLNNRISNLEEIIEERIPTRVLSESKFKEEVQDGNEIVDKIVSELKNLVQKEPTQAIQGPLTIVESKRIERIKSLLKRHEKLSSTELSDLMGLSRTRCNEYFKLMESMGMVKPILVGKEKYYGLKTK